MIPRYTVDFKEPRGGIKRGCDGEEWPDNGISDILPIVVTLFSLGNG